MVYLSVPLFFVEVQRLPKGGFLKFPEAPVCYSEWLLCCTSITLNWTFVLLYNEWLFQKEEFLDLWAVSSLPEVKAVPMADCSILSLLNHSAHNRIPTSWCA